MWKFVSFIFHDCIHEIMLGFTHTYNPSCVHPSPKVFYDYVLSSRPTDREVNEKVWWESITKIREQIIARLPIRIPHLYRHTHNEQTPMHPCTQTKPRAFPRHALFLESEPLKQSVHQ